jgi:hypothetical protein
VLALVLGAALSGACGDDGGTKLPPGAVVLDGSPRVPDAEGVVESIADDFSSLTLDGGRTFPLREKVQSFSSVDGSTQPLRRRIGQYVHVGLEGGKVAWVGGIAAVVTSPDGTKAVYYSGKLRAAKARRLEFADGTVLRLVDGAAPPVTAEGENVLATIDPDKRVVTALVPR